MSRRTAVNAFLAGALVSAALLHPAPACAVHTAGETPWAASCAAGPFTYSLEGSVGALFGTAYERVYVPAVREFKLSELVWDLKGIALAGVEGSLGFGDRFRVNVGYRVAVSAGSGMMVDRDWQYLWADTDAEWTDKSWGDVVLDSGSILDLNLAVRGYRAGAVALSGILGYKRDAWKWSDRGGQYIYSDIENGGWRDYTGSFPEGEVGITYEQVYSVPYFGVGADAAWGAFQMHTHLLYSPWAGASDTDNHLMREILFKGDFAGGNFFGCSLSGSWRFTPRIYVAAALEYQKFGEIRGDVSIRAGSVRQKAVDGGSVELAAKAVRLAAGVRF